jgi:dihydroflavonol-4-reductase
VSSARVLVTGGAGFLGAELVRRLVADGREVHVLRRPATDASALADLPLRWHLAELEDEQALRRAFASARQGAEAGLDVVHLAARISYRRADRALLQRVNVEGTQRVLALAAEVGVRRLCHVSSVVALGPVADPAHALEDDAPLRGRELASAYARTKAEAEELVLAAARELDAVVASPAVVFGRSAAGSNSQHFLARALHGRLGRWSPPGSLTVVGLADAAQGIQRVLERGTRGQRYLLGESSWLLHDLLALVGDLGKCKRPLGVVPLGLWRGLVAAARVADRIRPARRATPEALELLGLHFRFRARRAREELGWNPRPFPAVLAEIVAELARQFAGP